MGKAKLNLSRLIFFAAAFFEKRSSVFSVALGGQPASSSSFAFFRLFLRTFLKIGRCFGRGVILFFPNNIFFIAMRGTWGGWEMVCGERWAGRLAWSEVR